MYYSNEINAICHYKCLKLFNKNEINGICFLNIRIVIVGLLVLFYLFMKTMTIYLNVLFNEINAISHYKMF